MTSSIIKFKCNGVNLVSIYQHCDGYIEGVGYELAEWLCSKFLVNGIPGGTSLQNLANGAGCLVAQFIRDFKTDIGGLYITTSRSEGNYYYIVDIKDEHKRGPVPLNDITQITVSCYGKTIFEGRPSELLKFEE